MTGTARRIGFRDRFGRLSLRKRIGLLSGLGVGVIVALVSVAAFFTMRIALFDQLDRTLLEHAADIRNSGLSPRQLEVLPSEVLIAADVQIGLAPCHGTRGWSPKGELSAPPWDEPEREVACGYRDVSVRTGTRFGREYRVVAVPAGPGLTLILAKSTEPTYQILRQLGLVLLVVGGSGVALAAWSGIEIGRIALRPVERLTSAAEHVARTGDLRPIPVRGGDELARLAHAFNAMLTALAEARLRERRLIADAGHELRTPLTSLRTNLDLLAQSQHQPGLSPAEREGLLDDVRAQITELSSLVGDLVELSREEPPETTRAPLDLAVITAHAVERVQRRAPRVRFEVDLHPWTVVGDAQALERAVTNLLDNAAKWSPDEGVVTVRLVDGELSVADQGPGIAEADLPFVFERFYRSAEARTMPGSGLGLAIVKQAVERHGGEIHATRSSSGGALFVLRLPGSSEPSATPQE